MKVRSVFSWYKKIEKNKISKKLDERECEGQVREDRDLVAFGIYGEISWRYSRQETGVGGDERGGCSLVEKLMQSLEREIDLEPGRLLAASS